MKQLIATAVLSLASLAAHATLGSVSYQVQVPVTKGGADTALPLFDTNLFLGADLYNVTLTYTSTVEFTGSVTNQNFKRAAPGVPVGVAVQDSVDLKWAIKPPGQTLADLALQPNGVSTNIALPSPADEIVTESFDLSNTRTDALTWDVGSGGFNNFISDGTGSFGLADLLLVGCSYNQSKDKSNANFSIRLAGASCTAEVTYNFVPEPGEASLVVSAALLAGTTMRRRRSAQRATSAG